MIYLDTSVMLLALLEQPGAESARTLIEQAHGGRIASSALLAIEAARAIHREGLDMSVVDEFLPNIELLEISREVVDGACALTGELKSLDAIHLASALILHSDADPVTVLTHDARLAEAARSRGLTVVDPLAP